MSCRVVKSPASEGKITVSIFLTIGFTKNENAENTEKNIFAPPVQISVASVVKKYVMGKHE